MTQARDKAVKAARAVKRRLKAGAPRERGPVTLYLELDLYQAFRAQCETLKIAPSQVAEELLRAFLD